jgi:hypothetical protein
MIVGMHPYPQRQAGVVAGGQAAGSSDAGQLV